MSQTRLPAEWESQDAVILAWPHDKTDWQPMLPDIQQTFLEIIQQISRFENIVLIVPDKQTFSVFQVRAADMAIDCNRVIPLFAPYNDTWLRDSGPITVLWNERVRMNDYRFNGWGNKFVHNLDDNLTTNIAQRLLIDPDFVARSDIVLEGGSIDSDGLGTLLTTRQCLLNPNRNSNMTRHDYEAVFHRDLGIDRVLWLSTGELLGDDTDGHIDMLARFCTPDTIAFCSCHDRSDPHFEPLIKMKSELEGFKTRSGHSYHLIELPIPSPIYNQEQERLPASYCNFLVINNAVLVPVYDDPADEVACNRLAEVFTGREIIPVNAKTIIQQGGSLHCLTMQLPAGTFNL